MIRFEPNVRITYFSEPLARVLHMASVWALIERIGLVVNSADDGTHGPGTLHGFSLAIDLDTEGDKPEHLPKLHGYLARHLPTPYDVVLESTHVHVEFDVKPKAAARPPASA